MSGIYDILVDDYRAKMVHPVPSVPVISREQYILKKAAGKVVLDIGASGPMHDAIKQVGKDCYGIDIDAPQGEKYFRLDIDKADSLPEIDNLDIIIAGEVIEHVDNAGHFLDLLNKYDCKIILTTPNAFSSVAVYWMGRGVEQVNIDHKCWYSYTTLKTMVEKHGYNIIEWFWYNGQPFTAEGMIFLLERKNGKS